MFALTPDLTPRSASAERGDALFRQHQRKIYLETDKLFVRLMLAQWIAGIIAAVVVSPQTWTGQISQIHVHVWAALFLGGAITVFPIWLTRAWPGSALTRHVIAAAQMLMSALLISLSGGRIETHFHVFGSLVILSFYRDWRVLIPATLVVALDHFIRGIYWPYSVYGVLSASPWRSIEHAAWVLFEDIFLVISCLRSVNEMRSIANRTAALEASEQNFRQIFEEAPIGMAVVGLDERIQKANAAFCKMIDYSAEELAERTPLEITHPDDVAVSREMAATMLKETGSHRIEKRYLRKGGQVIWSHRTGCMIHDEAGQPRHFLIMIEDISERKRTEMALQETNRKLAAAHRATQQIMDNSQDVICTIDRHGRFLSVNQACETLWGYRPDELIGRAYADLLHPDDRERTAGADEATRQTGRISDFVNRYVRKDGSGVDVLWSASWSKTEEIFFCVAHDVTERLRIEKAMREAKDEADRANRAKSEFLSRMSHELRTPLNAILGFGQLLERQNPTPNQRSRIQHILDAGRHLLGLINEVLDISRIEADKIQLSVEPICVGLALKEALDLIRPLAAERSVRLVEPEQDESNLFVLADRQRFRQVLLNLLTNGVKYTPPGGSVTIDCHSAGKENVRLEVRDTGPGIAGDKLSRVFTPFDRLGAERSAIEGTGLGLALSQRLMEAMRGSIGVESTPGKGSTFWIQFLRTRSPLERVLPADCAIERKNTATLALAKRTILYIEDNLSNLTLIEQILQEEPGIELLSAMQGRIGLDLARQHAPELILLDLHLPDLPGWEVLAQLQADDRTRRIPTIVISADATSQQIKRLLAAGARDYLTKPVDIAQFFRILEENTAGARDPVAA